VETRFLSNFSYVRTAAEFAHAAEFAQVNLRLNSSNSLRFKDSIYALKRADHMPLNLPLLFSDGFLIILKSLLP
jgi:hypothetical protein